MKKYAIIIAALLCAPLSAAIPQAYTRVQTCGTGTPGVGSSAGYIDANGNICTTGTITSGGAIPLNYSGSANGTVGTTSGVLVAAGTYTRSLTIGTAPTSTTNVWIRLDGGVAAVGSGIMIAAGGGDVSIGTVIPMPTANITAITDSASSQPVWMAGG